MKISVWKALSLAGALAEGLTTATKDDEKISLDEAISIATGLATAAGLTMDFDNKKISAILEAIAAFKAATADGKLTIAELLEIVNTICSELGVELDLTGITIAKV